MDIIVLGSRGMLGQMVYAYFSKFNNYNVIRYDERFSQNNYNSWGLFISKYPHAVIINCIGKIKQKSDDLSELIWANAVLPTAICSFLDTTNYLIHASTDCVFDGKKGSPYSSDEATNALDAYGWSKRMGEIPLLNKTNVLILRVSIVGPNFSPSASDLLSWFLKHPDGTKLNGYLNHLWNGITTLEWTKQVEAIITGKRLSGIVQLGTEEHYSKYEMLLLFNDYFKKHFIIRSQNHPENIDRRLKPDIVCSHLEDQISEITKLI